MPPAPRPIHERFWPKVNKTDTCWLWTGALDPNGYGRFNADGQARLAHRVSYALCRGELDPTLALDHLCRVRNCVNPDHLEQVTIRGNNLRGAHPKAVSYRTGICQRGHVFSEVGVRLYRNGRRGCRQCIRDTGRAWAARRRLGVEVKNG